MADKSEILEGLVYGVDLKNRQIYFGLNLDTSDADSFGEVCIASVEMAVRAMHRMAVESPTKPIDIHMNSYGGDAYAMLRLHDAILACPCQVRFYGGGVVMSAATWVMIVCDERHLHPNTTVMVHDGADGFDGKHTDAQITAAEMRRLQDVLYDIYTVNSRMPKEFWQDVCQRDLYLTAEEAVMLGLADKIIEPKKRGNLRKMRQAAMRKKPESGKMKKLVIDVYKRINKLKVPSIKINEIANEPVDPDVFVDSSMEVADLSQQPKKELDKNIS